MGKKLDKILEAENKSGEFREYLEEKLGKKMFLFLETLSNLTNVIVFSGVTRDYFLKSNQNIRDFDIVIDGNKDAVIDFLKDYNYSNNSFGGIKLNIESLNVDIWELEKTWALSNNKVNHLLFNCFNLPATAFFNFSAIVYDYNSRKFIFGDEFTEFLETKEIDLVLEQNPKPELCIVNTIYYKHKFRLNISKNLMKYYIEHFHDFNESDYSVIQIKHFNKIKYSYSYLKVYLDIFKENISKDKKLVH